MLILDDLGAERGTSFGKECVFDVVNRRILSEKPMIVTTNLPLSIMKNASSIEDARIYDRVISVCAPICFPGANFRKGKSEKITEKARELLFPREE